MTPSLLIRLRCPKCGENHWEIDSKQRGLTEDVDFVERKYLCPHCQYFEDGYFVVQKSPPQFLMPLDPSLSRSEFDYWLNIFRTEFPNRKFFNDENKVFNNDLKYIALENIRPNFYTARIADEQLLQKTDLCLCVKSRMEKNKLIEIFSSKVSVASIETLNEISSFDVSGVRLIYQEPENLQKKGIQFQFDLERDIHFFLLDSDSISWNEIRQNKNIAVRIADEISGLELFMYGGAKQLIESNTSFFSRLMSKL